MAALEVSWEITTNGETVKGDDYFSYILYLLQTPGHARSSLSSLASPGASLLYLSSISSVSSSTNMY